MILISNTGPLITLAKIDKIDIIDQLGWEEVCIPEILLIMAKNQKTIDRVEPSMLALRSQGYWLPDTLISEARKTSGEQ